MSILAGTAESATKEGRDACLAYYFVADPVVQTRLVVWEPWSDSPALSAHFQHKNSRDTGAHLGRSGIVSAEFTKYRGDHVEPVYDLTGKPRGDFFQPKP